MQKVSKRQCKKLMDEILDRADKYKNVERPTHQDFLQEIQEDSGKSRTLDFLEAKGFISCTKNQVSGNLLRIQVNNSGITYREDLEETRHNVSKETRRYWITTGIAVVALIKAFLPEISEILARLWPPA